MGGQPWTELPSPALECLAVSAWGDGFPRLWLLQSLGALPILWRLWWLHCTVCMPRSSEFICQANSNSSILRSTVAAAMQLSEPLVQCTGFAGRVFPLRWLCPGCRASGIARSVRNLVDLRCLLGGFG